MLKISFLAKLLQSIDPDLAGGVGSVPFYIASESSRFRFNIIISVVMTDITILCCKRRRGPGAGVTVQVLNISLSQY